MEKEATKKLFDDLEKTMVYLWERWQDEKEFEHISEY
jgi:hypothetical protein